MRQARTPRRAEHLGPDRRRPQVLDTALQIAADDGLAGVTMAALSARMGVSRPVVYDCYPSRGDVLAALLKRETDLTLTRMAAILPPLKTGSVQQMFIDGFASLLDDVQHRPASWRIIFADDPDPVLRAAVARGRVQLAEHVSVVMRPLFERWEVQNIDDVSPVLTEIFLRICEASVRLMLSPDQRLPRDQLAEVVGSAAYRALRARPASA